MNIFITCSVRGMDEEYRVVLENHTSKLEKDGHNVHLPHRDTNQNASGYEICLQNSEAIKTADEVHVFYRGDSQGTHFDLGVAFALDKKIKVIATEPLKKGKSFARMIAEWEIYDKGISIGDVVDLPFGEIGIVEYVEVGTLDFFPYKVKITKPTLNIKNQTVDFSLTQLKEYNNV